MQVVPLNNAHLVDPQQYPRFTLVGQALGSVRMAFCALKMLRPQVSTASLDFSPCSRWRPTASFE